MNNLRTFILLLRGVMPMGKNKTPMAEFRKVLTQDGFGNVRTYIASGNALVDTDLSANEVEERVHDLIKEHIGPDLAVIARTGVQLQKVLNENPFKEGFDISRVFFVSFKDVPPSDKVAELLNEDFSPEKLVITDKTGYLFIPGSAARSVLSTNFIDKKLKAVSTSRNFNTMTKLVEMSESG